MKTNSKRFITFKFQDYDGIGGFGNTFQFSTKVMNVDTIRAIEKLIARRFNYKTVVITNYK